MKIKVGSLVKPKSMSLANRFRSGKVLFIDKDNGGDNILVGFYKDDCLFHSGMLGEFLSNGFKVPVGFRNRCYWFEANELIPIENKKDTPTVPKTQKIILWQDGNTVSAKEVSTGKVATATCSPDDTFDFYKGANIALLRLIEHI